MRGAEAFGVGSSLILATTIVVAGWVELTGAQTSHGRLFAPEDLGILESPDRDEWQQPEHAVEHAVAVGPNPGGARIGGRVLCQVLLGWRRNHDRTLS